MPPARASYIPMQSWEGEHQSYTQSIEGQYSFAVHTPPSSPSKRLKAYNDVTAELQGIIGQAVTDGKTLRPYGASWSLSKVAVAAHHLINTKALRIGFTLPLSQVSSTYTGDHTKLRFLECGASIAAINRLLFQDRLSLKASGSNNGQTLAGVVSTGTHGSAFKFGACQDFVVGLHLVTGPNQQVYLERASYPVMTPSFAAKLGASLIRDDVLFNAALVSFGSFGIIHGLMIEARDLFLLHAYRSFEPYNAALKTAISSLDFSNLTLPRSASSLYHFEIFFNPNEGTPPNEAIVLLMFEGPWTESYQPPLFDDPGVGPGVSALEIMGNLISSIPSPLNNAVKPVLNQQVKDRFAPFQKTGIIRDLFRGEVTRGKNLACGTGVPLASAGAALDVAFDTYANFGKVLPLLLSVRFVKATQALLGFTKFDPTCVLEIDAVNTVDTQAYLQTVWANLAAAGIPFTLHWGKFNSYLNAARVRSMYGDTAVDQWKASRTSLLESPAVGAVFSNGFLSSIGLAS